MRPGSGVIQAGNRNAVRCDRAAWGLAACAAIAAGAALSLATGGRSDVGLADLTGLLRGAEATLTEQTMRDIRLPRTLAAALLGACLGMAGLLLQAVTRNSLASPGLLGINQGAALGIVLGVASPGFSEVPLPLLSTFCALAAAALTFAVSGAFSGRIDAMRLILGGIAVGALGFAAVRLGYTLEDDVSRQIVRWTVGDVAGVRMDAVVRLAVAAAAGGAAAFAMAHRLNLIALGQAASHGLGADPRSTLAAGTAVAAVLTGVSVSVAGPIAFAGLVVPHLAKSLGGPDYRRLVPLAALLGAGLLAWADALSKLLPGTAEIPVGVVVALIGAPWLLAAVLGGKGAGHAR